MGSHIGSAEGPGEAQFRIMDSKPGEISACHTAVVFFIREGLPPEDDSE